MEKSSSEEKLVVLHDQREPSLEYPNENTVLLSEIQRVRFSIQHNVEIGLLIPKNKMCSHE